MMKLDRDEIAKVEELYTRLCASTDMLEGELEKQFKENAAQIKSSIENGVDNFYALFQKELNENTICGLIKQNMEGMSNVKKYFYLSNLILALTNVCGNILEGSEWKDVMEEHQAILRAAEIGLLTDDSEEIENGIDEMMGLITQNIKEFSVLFIEEPPYEELLEACMTKDASAVKALAANTRSSAVNMATALYILQEQGALASLGKEKIPPQEMGVMAASLMEIDAAHKSENWEKAKEIIEKAARSAMTLLATSPDLMKNAAFFSLVAIMSNFSILWMLISGSILFINMRIHQYHANNYLEPVFNTGAKVLSVTLDKVYDISHKFTEWVQTVVVPSSLSVWNRCVDFTLNRLLIPAASFLLKGKNSVVKAAGITVEKIQESLIWLRRRAADFGNKVMEHYAGNDSEEESEDISENIIDTDDNSEWEALVNEELPFNG